MAYIQTINPSHPSYSNYVAFVRPFNGLSFDRAVERVNELGLSFGAAYPERGRTELDINYCSICATLVQGAQGMEVAPFFEYYPENN